MALQEILKEKKMSIYKLSKSSNIPYATCNDIVNEKVQLQKCSAETIYKIAKVLNVSMESMLEPYVEKRSSFENFKSTICHRVKELGDIEFICETLQSNEIRIYFKRKWYPESFYLLAMLDYLSKENNVPLCDEYDDIRECKLEKVIYPASILALAAASKTDDELCNAEMAAIPEFKHFNIIESEIRNVI